jgi:hypothetical protein
MRSTRTPGPTDCRRDSAAPINGHGAGSVDGNGTGADAQASVGRRLSDFTLREVGLAKVLEGVTTLEEVLRVTTE